MLCAGVRPCPFCAGNTSVLFVACHVFALKSAGVAVRVAVQRLLVQQCLMFLGKEHYPCQPIPWSLMVPRVGNGQFTCDVCNRLSAGLSEPHRLALTLLRRGLLDFLHDPCPHPRQNIS